MDVAALVASLAAACAPAGVDLVAPVPLRSLAAVVPDHALPLLGYDDPLVVVLGNTERLWPRFVAWLRADPTRTERPHPLDSYVEEVVRAAVEPLPACAELRWAHELPPRRIPIQRLAEAAGLAGVSAVHLSVHPVHGPWISLRAVVVLGVDASGCAPPPPPPRPCDGCAARCGPLLRRALDASGATLGRDPEGAVRDGFAAWVAVRDACPVGRAHRFGADHVRYGYTKDRDLLRALARSPADAAR